jgi:parallel beta-helix repeat protein
MKKFLRRSHSTKYLFQLALGFCLLSGAGSSWAIVVTTTADSGTGSLRAAIGAANTDGVPTTITFDPLVFPAAAPATIFLLSPLPPLTGAGDTIDGGSGVILDGGCSLLPNGTLTCPIPTGVGLRVRETNITVRSVQIQYFPSDGIRVDTEGLSLIDGNTLIGNGSHGIRVSGGTGPDKRVDATVTNNTITDSARAGILVSGNLNSTPGDPGFNRVRALVDGNVVKRSRATLNDIPNFGGDGIDIVGGLGTGSNNSVTATVSNNDVFLNRDDGIVAVGCGLLASGSQNTVNVTIINNRVKDNGFNPELVTNTGIVVSGASREEVIGGGEEASTCDHNTVQFVISGNTVNGNRTQNISVSGGPGTSHHVQGIVSANSANGSPEGDGILISGGRGTGTVLQDITVSNNQVTGNFNRGIIITGGTETVNVVLTGIDVLSNHVRTNGKNNPSCTGGCQGILVTGGNLSQNATISDVLIDGNTSNSNPGRGIIVTRGQNLSAFPPLISLAGVTNNTASDNIDDGILIASSIPGSGATPVSGNRADGNDVDGIDLNSTGYVVSNNTASRNVAGAGIDAVGNVNGGGNKATQNASCNTPGCF